MKHSKFPLIGGQFVNVVYFDSKQTSPTGFSNFSYIECSNSYPIIEVKQWNLVPIDLSIPLLFGTAKSNRQLKSSFAIIPGPPTHIWIIDHHHHVTFWKSIRTSLSIANQMKIPKLWPKDNTVRNKEKPENNCQQHHSTTINQRIEYNSKKASREPINWH